MPWYRVTYRNGASKTFMAASPEQARSFAKAEYSGWRGRHPGTYYAGSSAREEDAGHRIAKVEKEPHASERRVSSYGNRNLSQPPDQPQMRPQHARAASPEERQRLNIPASCVPDANGRCIVHPQIRP